MDGNTKFLIDECLSPQLAEIAKREFGVYAIHVPWLGSPPRGSKSWQDPDIVARLAVDPHVLVTNNRRDFVRRFYRAAGLNVHEGLVIILQRTDIVGQRDLFRNVMKHVIAMDSTINKLIEIDLAGNIEVAEWPDLDALEPWRDPFERK